MPSAFGIEHDITKGLPSALRAGKATGKYALKRIEAHDAGKTASAILAQGSKSKSVMEQSTAVHQGAFAMNHGARLRRLSRADIAKSGAPKKDMSPKEIRTGQALNVVATLGGMNAMRMATGEFRHALKNQSRGIHQPTLPGMERSGGVLRTAGRALKYGLKTKSGKAGLIATGGMLGLHSAELAGDAIAARSLNHQYKKATSKQPVYKAKIPSHAIHGTHGKVRVTGMVGKDHFQVLDKTDTSRVFHRSHLTFLPEASAKKPKFEQGELFKALPKAVPDQLSSMLPGSTVRAYDNSKKHKVRAAAGNVGAKTLGAAVGGAAGVGLAAVAGKKLKPLQGATKIAFGGLKVGSKQAIKARRITLTRDMKRGWAQSSIVGTMAGGTGSYAGNRQLKHVQRDKTYGYGR